MITEKRRLGNAGEDRAVEYLVGKGYSLLGRNVQASHHEVDIVMRDGEWLVFVEVKTRQSDYWCDPIRAVDDEKLWNLVMASNSYRKEYPECCGLRFRIDVVCVVGDARGMVCGSSSTSSSSSSSGTSGTSGTSGAGEYRIEHYVNPFQRRILERKPWKTHYRRLRKKQENERYLKGWERMEKERLKALKREFDGVGERLER